MKKVFSFVITDPMEIHFELKFFTPTSSLSVCIPPKYDKAYVKKEASCSPHLCPI